MYLEKVQFYFVLIFYSFLGFSIEGFVVYIVFYWSLLYVFYCEFSMGGKFLDIFFFGMNFLMFLVVFVIYSFIFFCCQVLEKFKYEQSLEIVRYFIVVIEKELEFYYRYIVFYGNLEKRNCNGIVDNLRKDVNYFRNF